MKPTLLSAHLISAATLGYLTAMFFYVLHLIAKKKWTYWLAPSVMILSMTAHGASLIDRWIQGGLYRPPWTNLYESLVYFSFGLAVVAVIIDLKFRLRYVGAFVSPFVFSALGLAYLVPIKEITPLVPSLQSWWILAHSCLAAFAYSGFLVASTVAFLYLIKTGVSHRSMGLWTSALLLVTLVMVAGKRVFLQGQYLMNEVVWTQGHWQRNIIPNSDPIKFFEVSVPFIPQIVWVAAALSLLAFLLYLIRSTSTHRLARKVLVLAWGSHVAMIVALVWILATYQSVGLGSNPYSFTLLILMAAIEGFNVLYLYHGKAMISKLPEAVWLERLSYQVTLFAFPFMTLILITGAIWAHEAWGRYWGWDPKETTALVTWLIYAAYLHGRFTPGWTGKRAAVISIIGFFSVIFTYLGTNLVLSGLHSYGSQ